MIENFTINSLELDYIFGGEERDIELNFGSIQGEFWGENISMVSAIVGKNGTGKSSILRYIKKDFETTRGLRNTKNIIFYSPHLDYNDNYNFDPDPSDLSLDSILRRDLDEIATTEKEPNESGWKKNPKEDLSFLNTSRQVHFLSSGICKAHPIFSEIFEGLKFGNGRVFLRGTTIDYKEYNDFHNTPSQFKSVILSILNRCEQEIDKWVDIRIRENNRTINQHQINGYIFKRKIIISFLSVVIKLMESRNSFLNEGICDIDYKSGTAIEIFKNFLTNAQVYFRESPKESIHNVFPAEVHELFNLIYHLVDQADNEDFVSNKSFVSKYNNIEKILVLQKAILNNLSNNYYFDNEEVLNFLGSKATDRNLSSGENALLNFYSVLYEYIQKIDEDDIYDEYILLLDEADLGYHPEWKKRFVNSIVKSLPLFFKFSNNQSRVQIIFTTHDPLTLSDIPRQNVVFLDRDADGYTIISNDAKETFGANIHDLLADSFFISDSLMGDFAKEKIDRTIVWLRFKLLQKEIESFVNLEDISLEQKKQEKHTIELENRWVVESSKEQHRQIIDLIDEPLLKYKMNEMYYQIFPNEINKKDAMRRINEIARSSGLNIDIRE